MSALRHRRDLGETHVIVGYEQITFSSEADARAAIDLAHLFCGDEMKQELRYLEEYRKAELDRWRQYRKADRAKEQA
jgi:hypothetical protein